jgi:hypothetical protein
MSRLHLYMLRLRPPLLLWLISLFISLSGCRLLLLVLLLGGMAETTGTGGGGGQGMIGMRIVGGNPLFCFGLRGALGGLPYRVGLSLRS